MNYNDEVPELIDLFGELTKEAKAFKCKKQEEYYKQSKKLYELQESKKNWESFLSTKSTKDDVEKKENEKQLDLIANINRDNEIKRKDKILESRVLFGFGIFALVIIYMIIIG